MCLGYRSTAMKKHHDQGIKVAHKKKVINCGLGCNFSGCVRDLHDRELGSWQAWRYYTVYKLFER